MKRTHQMNLKILLPTRIFIDSVVNKLIAEGPKGSFCLLPNHIDYTEVLVPGILVCHPPEENPYYVAVDEGILVKKRDDVFVSVFDAVKSDNLEKLETVLDQRYQRLDAKEKRSRSALAMLEGGIIKKFQETLS